MNQIKNNEFLKNQFSSQDEKNEKFGTKVS